MDTNQNFGAGQTGSTSFEGGTSSSQTSDTSTIEETKEKARQAASEAQRKITDQLRTSADSGKARAADTLGSMAQALTTSGQQLRSANDGMPSQYVERAGEQLRRASDYLRNTSVDEIVTNTESLARRQPALFIGGAFAIGFLAARLIKAAQSGGNVPRSRSLVPQASTWTGDRERPVYGYREPRGEMMGDASQNDAVVMDEFTRDTR